MTLNCKYCQTSFCTSCIALEKHECKEIEKYKNENKHLLEEKLNSATYSKAEKLNI
jgi:predicted nucleic acid binding AN1-type Zn finger protein